MYRITFRISGKQERSLTRSLASAGIMDYFIETSGSICRLYLFSDSPDVPDAMNGLKPESVDESDELSWRHSWAAAFSGHELTCDIYVCAQGAPLPQRHYRHVIKIDPRDSFGDGHHPTTRLCAMLLQNYLSSRANPEAYTMLDIGTGSGVLAVAAYILGIRMIELFDIDETAVDMARRNLLLNGISGIIPFRADIYTHIFMKQYDIITANLLTGLIEDNIGSINGALKAEGVLIVSGISAKWARLAIRLFKKNNLIILEHKKLEGWNGFLLKKLINNY